ncbi:hypothetical protein ACJJH9_05275 [Microbulbifer sp. DLAB2-AF]|uniref:hypothetical protein n=1 Tax=Microbulbifer sp. DLAB2-AF TaxID=3243395 RepID=UPI0040390EA9
MRGSTGIYWLAPALPAAALPYAAFILCRDSPSRAIQASSENTGADAWICWYLLARAGTAGSDTFLWR